MCGIVGINRCVLPKELEAAVAAIAHRGPDDVGNYISPTVGLGHRRLAIQDLSASGHQPMSTMDGQVWIVFNGEIYNHWELRHEMPEFHFRGASDTETLLYGYVKYGKSIVSKLNGIFAFAIYDCRTNELFVARDQLGVKPLYYYFKDGLLIFASELKAILCFHGLDLSQNYRAFVNYIHYLWSPGPDTPYEYVKKLGPGQCFTYGCGKDDSAVLTLESYYELPFDGKYSAKSEIDLIDELDDRLTRAVERQLLSDVPVGFFLSGGLDSSLLAAIARKKVGPAFNCYTIKSEGRDRYDNISQDYAYARQVAKDLGVNLIEVEANASMLNELDDMVWYLDEPQSDPAAFNVRNICKEARNHGDIVLIGGTGGDDLFSGYRRHEALRLESALAWFPKSLAAATANGIGNIRSSNRRVRMLKKLVSGFAKDRTQRMVGYYAWLELSRNKAIFLPEIRDTLNGYCPSDVLRQSLANIPSEQTLLNQMLYWDLKFFLTDHNLNYTDKAGMSHGVEIRVPYLDIELVNFACQLPVAMKMRGRTTKYILRRLAERYLSREIIGRRKTGFGAPVRSWLYCGAMDSIMATHLSQASLDATRLFSPQAVQKLISDSKSGVVDGAYSIVAVIAIQSWAKQFCGEHMRAEIGSKPSFRTTMERGRSESFASRV